MFVPGVRPPACLPIPTVKRDPLFEILFDKDITWLGETHVHRSWETVSVCTLIEREGLFKYDSKGVHIPAGLLVVAPIWAEHQQAYIDHGCPWYLLGRGVTYVPIGVYEWSLPLGLPGIVMDFLIGEKSQQSSFCKGHECLSREYWGISGLNKEGQPTGGWFDYGECVTEYASGYARQCRNTTPEEWERKDRDLSRANP